MTNLEATKKHYEGRAFDYGKCGIHIIKVTTNFSIIGNKEVLMICFGYGAPKNWQYSPTLKEIIFHIYETFRNRMIHELKVFYGIHIKVIIMDEDFYLNGVVASSHSLAEKLLLRKIYVDLRDDKA